MSDERGGPEKGMPGDPALESTLLAAGVVSPDRQILR